MKVIAKGINGSKTEVEGSNSVDIELDTGSISIREMSTKISIKLKNIEINAVDDVTGKKYTIKFDHDGNIIVKDKK